MSRDTKIKDTKRVLIGMSGQDELEKYFLEYGTERAIPKSREYIPLLADEACVQPCRLLYDMGLRTVNSGANVGEKGNEHDTGFIGIDYNSMSDENKLIADELARKGIISPINRDIESSGSFIVTIEVPLTSETTVGEVEKKLMELASLFQPQDVLYGRKTEEDIRNEFIDNGDGTYHWNKIRIDFTREEMEEQIEYELQELQQKAFYDGEKYYYATEELLNIHMDYINRKKRVGR